MTFEDLRTAVLNRTARPGWATGVLLYAEDLLDSIEERLEYDKNALDNTTLLHKALLNGARDWEQYSFGACSLVYDGDIAKRVCTHAAYERCGHGTTAPAGGNTWLGVQARALSQAEELIIETYIDIKSSALDSKEG